MSAGCWIMNSGRSFLKPPQSRVDRGKRRALGQRQVVINDVGVDLGAERSPKNHEDWQRFQYDPHTRDKTCGH